MGDSRQVAVGARRMVSNLHLRHQEQMQAVINEAPPTTYDSEGWNRFIPTLNLERLSPELQGRLRKAAAVCVHKGESRGTHFSENAGVDTHLHEFGHQLDKIVLTKTLQSRNNDLYNKAKKRQEAITNYALTNAGEYFAENCTYYMYKPRVLEEKSILTHINLCRHSFSK